MAVVGFRRTEHPLPDAEELWDSLIERYGHSRTIEYVMDFIEELEDLMAAEPQMQELFGNQRNPPLDQSIIIHDDDLSHKHKVAKLKALRASKAKQEQPTPIKAPVV